MASIPGTLAPPLGCHAGGAALWWRSWHRHECAAAAAGQSRPLVAMLSLESQQAVPAMPQQAQQAQRHAQRRTSRPSQHCLPPPAPENLATVPPAQPPVWHVFWHNPLASRSSTADAERRATTTTSDGERTYDHLRRMSRTLSGKPAGEFRPASSPAGGKRILYMACRRVLDLVNYTPVLHMCPPGPTWQLHCRPRVAVLSAANGCVKAPDGTFCLRWGTKVLDTVCSVLPRALLWTSSSASRLGSHPLCKQ